MFTVALTGGIGSGKSTVAALFAQQGVAIIDADVIAHHLTAPAGIALPLLRAQFGAAIFTADKQLNRAALREYIFNDTTARHQLEAILHPLIFAQMEQELSQVNSTYALLVIPLLLETQQQHRVQHIIVVDAPETVQIARVQARSGLTPIAIQRIMAQQIDRHTRLAAADTIIDNSGDLAALAPQVITTHRALCQHVAFAAGH